MNMSQSTELRNKRVTEVKKQHREVHAQEEKHCPADKLKQLLALQVGDTACIKRPPLAQKNNVKIEAYAKSRRSTLTVNQVCSN